jgi:hypothetical protein
MSARHLLVFAALCIGASGALSQRAGQVSADEQDGADVEAARQASHVLVLTAAQADAAQATEAMLAVLEELDVAREQATKILDRLQEEGEVIVAQGTREALEPLGAQFQAIDGVGAKVQSIEELQVSSFALGRIWLSGPRTCIWVGMGGVHLPLAHSCVEGG